MCEGSEKVVSRGNGKEIWVNEFTEQSAQMFREQVLERSEFDANMVLVVYIDSFGGSADALAKMLATMDEVPNRFVTVAMGKAMSCGAILLSHGDIRYVDKYATVMIHNIQSVAVGDSTHIRASSEEIERVNRTFLGLLATNCGKTYDELQTIIKSTTDSKDLYMGAKEALQFGICDFIGLPQMIPIIQWVCETKPEKEDMPLNVKDITDFMEIGEDADEEPVKVKKPAKKKTKKPAAKKRKKSK